MAMETIWAAQSAAVTSNPFTTTGFTMIHARGVFDGSAQIVVEQASDDGAYIPLPELSAITAQATELIYHLGRIRFKLITPGPTTLIKLDIQSV